MVKIDGGSFKSGIDGKSVDVKAFEIDKFEVTNEAFKKFYKELEIPAGKEKHPVVDISYFEAADYCKSVGKRLPTGTEWEKAARGTDGRSYPWGNSFNGKNANTIESGVNGTTTIGSFPSGASPYGALDMCGNVWEWVDAWESDDKRYRVVLGGSYFDDAGKGKVFSSLQSIPDDIHEYIGFRCAK